MIRLFRVFIPTSVLLLLVSEILLTAFAFTVAIYVGMDFDSTVFLLYDGGILRIALLVLAIIGALYMHDAYENIQVRSRIYLVQMLLQVIGIAFLVEALLGYINPELTLPRSLMVTGSGLTLVLLAAWRILYTTFALRVFGAQQILFLGANDVVCAVAERIVEKPEYGLAVAGYVLAEEEDTGAHLPGGKVLGKIPQLKQIVQQVKPARIVVGLKERRARMPVYDLLDLRFSGIRIEESAVTYEETCGRVCTKELRPAQLIFSGALGPNPGNLALQSVYSSLLALVGLAVMAPVLLVVALLVKLTSRGPILYRQKRVGMDGQVFTLLKFRSMYVDAEARSGAVWASKNDPRVTPVGRWLRKTRLDEFPQLINVLKGEMSIVGPRPERPEFVQMLSEKIPYYRQRHAVKPGITGWAQINHEYADTIEDTITKLEYDLYYIKNLSPSLDAYIIFHTVKTMLLTRGAR